MLKRPQSQATSIYTLDMNFRDIPGSIAVYLIPHNNGAVLVECGPGSTIHELEAGLKAYGFQINDITDVLLTHIHLDHAGAAGWLAQHGARVHVHPVGAPHLVDPGRLLDSARRIYGDMMEALWGEFLPVPEDRLSVLEDDGEIEIQGLRFRPLDTPGHAYHHFVYLFEDVCFSGDIGGVRMGGTRHLRLPMPPPEFHLELWRESILKLQTEYNRGAFRRIAPTHYGIFDDADWHLRALKQAIDEVEMWMVKAMAANPSLDELNEQFMQWTEQRSLRMGLEPAYLSAYESAIPSWMSAGGIFRYWQKIRNTQKA